MAINKIKKFNFFFAIFVILCLALFRYDIVFFMPKTTVVAGNTMWELLRNNAFKNNDLTRLSLNYLEEQNPAFNFNKIMANESDSGGYTISVFLNKISVIGPNNKPVLNKAALFPFENLISHALQVISYNFFIIGVMYFLYTALSQSKFRISKSLIIDTIVLPIFFAVATLLILIAGVFTASSIFYLIILLSGITH